MSDAPGSKPAFWSSLPGILTGIGGVIVATTGLITALYSTGVIGKDANSNSNAVPPVSLAAAPSPAPTVTQDLDRYKALAGRWKVVEEPPQDPYFRDEPRITWTYDAAVQGSTLTLTGKILFINNPSDPPVKDEKNYKAGLIATLAGMTGDGAYEYTGKSGFQISNDATLRMKDNLKEFDVEIRDDSDGKIYRLKGRKLP
jgi:hypothetical protein